MAGLAALEQAIISLCVKYFVFVKARPLKAVVYIGCEHEIILVLYQAV